MTADLVLSNAKAYVEHEIVNCSIAIDNARILTIGKDPSMPQAMIRIDLHGMLVLPGLIDAHVHLRDEGKAYKEDFFTGTAAAAAGGFTTVLDMPNNDPVTMSAETLRSRMQKARKRILTNVGFYSEFPNNMKEIERIVQEGNIAFKLFMAHQIGELNVDDDNSLLEAFRILDELDIPVAVHAEDKASLKETEEELKLAGENDIEAFLMAHSENVEVKAVKRILDVAKHTDARVHFCHVSSKTGLDTICKAKESGMPITCETTPHNLVLYASDLKKVGMVALTMPPVREARHATALWNGIGSGCIDIIASDHAPHASEEKKAETIWKTKVGIPGLETTLPLLLTEVNHQRLSLADVVRLLSEKPAEIFRLKDRGALEEGNSADLTIVDLKRQRKIDASKFLSKAKYSPFDGWQVQGAPVKTFVNGQLIMDEGEIVGKAGSGSVIRRENT